MKITERYDQLIAELQRLQAGIAHVARGDYSIHQRRIDAAGVAVIEFEQRHGIADARLLLEHEKTVLPQLEQFEASLAHYSEPLRLDPITFTSDEIEQKTAERSALLFEVKKSVKTLSGMRDDIVTRRKKLLPEAMQVAADRDPLGEYERSVFTEAFTHSRATRATKELVAA